MGELRSYQGLWYDRMVVIPGGRKDQLDPDPLHEQEIAWLTCHPGWQALELGNAMQCGSLG